MRVLDLTDLPRRPVADFGSVGFAVSPVGRGGDTHHVVLTLEPGGVIGRHDAVGGQLLVVLAARRTCRAVTASRCDSPPAARRCGSPARATRPVAPAA